jgi:hypothetical protein
LILTRNNIKIMNPLFLNIDLTAKGGSKPMKVASPPLFISSPSFVASSFKGSELASRHVRVSGGGNPVGRNYRAIAGAQANRQSASKSNKV